MASGVTLLFLWARQLYPLFSTGSTPEDRKIIPTWLENCWLDCKASKQTQFVVEVCYHSCHHNPSHVILFSYNWAISTKKWSLNGYRFFFFFFFFFSNRDYMLIFLTFILPIFIDLKKVYCLLCLLHMGPSRENLSSGFPKKWDSNQPAQLQRLARNMKYGS